MTKVKAVKIDGEEIHIFNSALYIFESSAGYTLELDIIVTEVVEDKYRQEENLIIEIELEDGRIISAIMNLKVFTGGLPQLNLYCELGEDELDDYPGIDRVHESDLVFPNAEEGVTLEEIRKVEMPDRKIRLNLTLPIDQVEWLGVQKNKRLNQLFKQWIYEYWAKNGK